MALMLAPVSLPWPLFLVACLFTLASLYVVAKDGNRRLMGALLLACILAAPAIVKAEDHEVILSNRCPQLTVWDPEYWLLGCYMLPS
jgi:hypothetical protein